MLADANRGADLSLLTARERDVVLAAVDGAGTRALAERLCLSPRTVEHHLSSAYRKLGVPNRTALVALVRQASTEEAPVTRYAVSGDAHVAYQVIGEGPRDLILIPGFVSNVETAWTWPALAGFLRRLGRGRRLIVFDKRGTGLSDPVTDPAAMTLEQRMDEVRAVMDAADSTRAALLGFSEGAALSMLFSASYPARTNGLVLYGALVSPSLDTAANPALNIFADPSAAWQAMREVWGTGQFLARFVPSVRGQELDHVARFERHGASPAAAYAIVRLARAIEVRGLCPAVTAPSLVLHRRDDLLVPPANGRYLGTHLPDARYVELDGRDHPPWIGDSEPFFTEVDRFLASDHPANSAPVHVLQALLVTDRPLDLHLLGTVQRFRGRISKSGGHVVCTFDGVVRAVACALELSEEEPSLRLAVHAGEVDAGSAGARGPAVDVAVAALGRSSPGRVLATGVVKDLALGSALEFRPLPASAEVGGAGPFVVGRTAVRADVPAAGE